MTTLEIILLVALVYLIIGIIVFLNKPEEYFLIPDPDYERFLDVMSILLWPFVLIRLLIETTEE